MPTRGEKQFVRFPRFAARFYDRLTHGPGGQVRFQEMADRLAAAVVGGRVLEVGFGAGRLLLELHRRCSALELHGIDVSAAMVELAKKNLTGVPAALKRSSIEKTDYPPHHFDLVTCAGSLYLWDNPGTSLQEVERILKPGGKAVFFETRRETERRDLLAGIAAGTREESFLRRMIAPLFLRKALRMTYSRQQFEEIFRRSPFGGRFEMEPVTLARMPMWWQITLQKPA